MTSNYTVSIGPSMIKYSRAYTDYKGTAGSAITNPLVGISDISFSSTLFGGYDAANIIVTTNMTDSLVSGPKIGREIRIYNVYGIQVWEGFINRVIVQSFSGQMTYGPVLEISNYVNLLYTEFGGSEMETGFRSIGTPAVRQSLADWGRMSEIVSSPAILGAEGSEMANEAGDMCDAITNLLATPKQEFSIVSPGIKGNIITYECLGYFHLTKKAIADYYYSEIEPAPADTVIMSPMRQEMPGFFREIDIKSQAGKYTLVLYNDKAESAYAFLETMYSNLSAQALYAFSFGVYDNRSVVLYENVKPRLPDISVSAKTGEIYSPGRRRSPPVIRPGMWGVAVDMPSISVMRDTFFLVSGVEVSNDTVSINQFQFSAINRILGGRGL